ncbi:type IV toxin-antitoxin system AbiEi family antitoxin domain-containing protein [Luteococcus peritonei]|uniref:Type IV toxin-antitoxin system AbiEi family antitoxin domain-containing protein n=1 Tax=Luteococcus peritonei TaxID=88874 RepID=A0ABW4RSN6_9ACTN
MNPSAPDPSPVQLAALHSLCRRSELEAVGFDHREIARMLRDGRLHRTRRGVYAWGDSRGDIEQHLIQARAVLLAQPRAVLSHGSAAALHRIPVRRAALDWVHVTRPDRGGGRRRNQVVTHCSQLDPSECMVVDALAVTTVPRSLVDLGCTEPEGWTLAAMDDALRRGLCSAEHLQRSVTSAAGRPGVRGAQRAAALADPRSESVGESLSRHLLVRAGLAPAQLQQEFPHEAGVDRVDFWWEEGVVGEFDGRLKYRASARPGVSPEEVLWQEKLREDRLRRLGLVVVRWTWDELLHQPEVVVARVRQALAEARTRRPSVAW